ncbi:peptidylprolyl isomerase [Hyunsoonleella pacifica]|uniref:peptidylprolyl isomerase n=1 Tax=Hyunsoonleella pacifica TaxID=1080224 RepID=A0A4Q9FRP4_9FLAO|nr:peptidylprolyl isomerase [Hyunsoonleella pacifica]TBN18577.1 peptidylprolyl isomerase [Hyunsoonleella pacifica]GGD02962.1 peptidylprolyl isomerase [Hyunsoonleella pacifica]
MFKQNTACILFAVVFILGVSGCKSQYPELEDGIYAEINTTKGKMIAKLHYKKAPITSANFISLTDGTNTLVTDSLKGKKFYDGLIFHRVMDKFMIQGGDPLGTGLGNPGYRFMDEIHPDLKHDKPGVLAMANAGANTNGSQFYITEVPRPDLDNRYSVFGELVIGLDVQDSISNVKTDNRDKPLDSVVINQLNIIRKGKEAKQFDAPEVFKNHFIEREKKEKAQKARREKILKETVEKHTKQKQDAVTLESGLKYFISEKGNGAPLKVFSKAKTHYALFFEDGTLLDTSNLNLAETLEAVNERKKAANRYIPITADLSPDAPMIAGFKEGLQQLNVGDKATLFIPYHLAYGEAGIRGIPPKTNLIFEVEILSLAK